MRSHDAGANYTHLRLCVCVSVCAAANCTRRSRSERRQQLSTGNWQHSNPISHACNHHDHYERKCRKSRRFLTATERPPSDRAAERQSDRQSTSLAASLLSPPATYSPRESPRPLVFCLWQSWHPVRIAFALFILLAAASHCAGHKKAHKTLWHAKSGDAAADAAAKAAEVRGRARARARAGERQLEVGSGILCRQQLQQMTLIAFLGALFAAFATATVAVAVAVATAASVAFAVD